MERSHNHTQAAHLPRAEPGPASRSRASLAGSPADYKEEDGHQRFVDPEVHGASEHEMTNAEHDGVCQIAS